MKKEVRLLSDNIATEKNEEGMPTLVGYALKFNKRSDVLGYFYPFVEILDSRCLDDTDMGNVVALINHDENLPLARTGVNLELEVDEIGLKFRFKPSNTSYARDLIANMESGIITQCSFAFTIPDEEDAEIWENTEEVAVRTIKKIDKLYDVSIVTTPAYSDTEAVVSPRSKKLAEEIFSPKKDEKREKLILEAQVYMI